MAFKIEQECRQGRPAAVYLFHGEEDFLIERAVRQIEEAAGRGPFPAKERYAGKEVLARDLLESACTLPLGNGFQLLIIDDAQAIPATERGKLLPYLDRPCASSCVVFICQGKRLDARNDLLAALKLKARTVEFSRLKTAELKTWAKSEALARGLKPEPAALDALVKCSGGALRELAAELDKAALSAGPDGRLALTDLAALSRHGGRNVWQLAEMACGTDAGAALLALDDVLGAGGAPTWILNEMAKRVRRLLEVTDIAKDGGGEAQVAQRLRIYPWQAAGCLAQAKRGRGRLVEMLSEVLQAEFSLKTSAAPERELLERLVLRLTTS
ncbi:MAG: DNA polymerase III subunit delta [Pseudomonadota bacterium]